MWDKMETPTIVYDLDTSGGLMEQIQTLLAPPKSRDGESTGRRPARTSNHDTCDSCREGGDLLCCEHCPAAFHLQCCNPPLSEAMLPPGDWMCHRCNVRSKKREQKAEQTNGLPERPLSRLSSSPTAELDLGSGPLCLDGVPSGAGAAGPGLRAAAVAQVRLLERHRCGSRPGTPISNASSSSTPTPSEDQTEADEETAEAEDEAHGSEPEGGAPPSPRLLKGPFQLLITAAMERNPTQFQLPNELTCTSILPGSSKRRREELMGKAFRRPQQETDPGGLVPLPMKVCFSCNRSCRIAPLVQCNYCPLLFHMDCLDPPLTAMPTGTWMCPNHIEHLVLNQRSLNLANRCQLFDHFQDRMSQHAVKVDFLRRVHRRNPPNLHSAHPHRKKTLKVPDGIKSQYHNPPPLLAPAAARAGELVCNGVADQEHGCSSQRFTSELEQQEWLRDVISLQCSILRHLSAKHMSSLSHWDSKEADIKLCVGTEQQNSLQPSSGRTASPVPCSKPCSTLDAHQGISALKRPVEEASCGCSDRPCQNCTQPNGPLAKANRPDGASDVCRQTELQHRLKPPQTLPAASQGPPNHKGGVMVKTESTKPLDSCALRDGTPSHTVCPQTLTHGAPPGPASSLPGLPSSGAHTFTPPRSVREPGPATALPSAPSTGFPLDGKASFGALSPLAASADLSGCLKGGIDGDGEIELNQLDEELVKLLALQRIQQLFPPKAPPTPQSSCAAPSPTTVALKPLTPRKETQTKEVKARATFYPLLGRGGAINMCYRTLYIGSGADMDVCLTNYGQCNYVSGKHACIFYDENTKHYELLNYSEHGTTVDNVLYSCDFSEKSALCPAAASLPTRGPGLVRHCKSREPEQRSGTMVGLMPAGGVMSSQPQGGGGGGGGGGPRLSCSCKASSSSLIGGSGAGWEGTALLHHGSYVKLGCLQFVFSIAELAGRQPKEEASARATTASNQEGAHKAALSHGSE